MELHAEKSAYEGCITSLKLTGTSGKESKIFTFEDGACIMTPTAEQHGRVTAKPSPQYLRHTTFSSDHLTRSDMSKQRILIVDDEPSAREGLARLVSNWNFNTNSAENGEKALALIS